MFRRCPALLAILFALLPCQARGAQAAPAVTADRDAVCLLGVGMAIAGPGSDPGFMGAEHDSAVETMRMAVAFFGGRLTLHHDGAALEQAVRAAGRAAPRDGWLREGARCLDEFAAAGPRFAGELERALAAAGIPRDRSVERTPADAATLDPDLACIAIILQMQQRVAQAGASAPPGAAIQLEKGRAFFLARAMARLPAETRGALFATTMRSLRDDQGEQVYNQCRARLSREMDRILVTLNAVGRPAN